MINLKPSENSHGARQAIILSLLITAFFIITYLVANNNIFIINLDNSVQTFIANRESPSLTETMLSITKIGNVFETFIIFIIFGLFLILKNKKYFYIFTLATASGIMLVETIKIVILKARPVTAMLTEQGYSFPSYHATIAMIFLLSSVFLLIPLMKKGLSKNIFVIITFIIFPLVAFSRIYLFVHWTSDVIAGIILGAICFIFAEIICCHKKENVL